MKLNELALFAGAGGGILGGKLLGWRTVCAVEWDAYARDVLVARQDDGCLDPFPIWDDVQTFDGKPWRGLVDVVSGGFPCQDISAAGKGAGIEGERSGMWKHMARIIGEVLPQFVFVENSPLLVGRGLEVVLADLAEMGYDAEWGIVGAHHTSAPHKRDRIWIVAHASGRESGQPPERERRKDSGRRGEEVSDLANPESTRLEGHRSDAGQSEISEPWNYGASKDMGDAASVRRYEEQAADDLGGSQLPCEAGGSGGATEWPWWATEPDVGRVAHGVAARVDRLRAIGNGQVPAVAALAWEILTQNDTNSK
jgi:DNA (cytosine-5)-methyltransferase 1